MNGKNNAYGCTKIIKTEKEYDQLKPKLNPKPNNTNEKSKESVGIDANRHPNTWFNEDVQRWICRVRTRDRDRARNRNHSNQKLELSPDRSQTRRSVTGEQFFRFNQEQLRDILCASDSKVIRLINKEMGILCHRWHITRNAMPGVIGLRNLGNTCYMNSAVQVVLQMRGLAQALRQAEPEHEHDAGEGFWQKTKDFVYSSLPSRNGDGGGSLLSAFQLLAKEANAADSSPQVFCPTQIRHCLTMIDKRFGNGDQDDCAVVLAVILQELDKNFATEYARGENENFDERAFMKKTCGAIIEEFSDDDDEEDYVEEYILDPHNPFESPIRKHMDGVVKDVCECFACGGRSIIYSTFRDIKLPRLSRNLDVQLAINYSCNSQCRCDIKRYRVLDYCSLDVLRAQIARDYKTSLDSVMLATFEMGSVTKGNNNNLNLDACAKWFASGNRSACESLRTCDVIMAGIDESKTNNNMINLLRLKLTSSDKDNSLKVSFLRLEKGNYSGSDLIMIMVDPPSEHEDVRVFLADDFVRPNCDYEISDSNTAVLVICTPKTNSNSNSNSNRNKKLKSWNLDLAVSAADLKRINKYVYQAVLQGNDDREDLEGISRTSKRRSVSAKSSRTYEYDADYINSLDQIHELAARLLEDRRRVHELLSSALQLRRASLPVVSAPEKPLENVLDALALYEQEQILDEWHNIFECETCRCNSHVFKKQSTIVECPTNLILNIDRSDFGTPHKFTHFVQYPTTSKLTVGRQTKQEYELVATCMHSSSALSHGHYYANVKSVNNGNWYCADDHRISPIKNFMQLLSQHSVVLIYTKAKQSTNGQNQMIIDDK